MTYCDDILRQSTPTKKNGEPHLLLPTSAGAVHVLIKSTRVFSCNTRSICLLLISTFCGHAGWNVAVREPDQPISVPPSGAGPHDHGVLLHGVVLCVSLPVRHCPSDVFVCAGVVCLSFVISSHFDANVCACIPVLCSVGQQTFHGGWTIDYSGCSCMCVSVCAVRQNAP